MQLPEQTGNVSVLCSLFVVVFFFFLNRSSVGLGGPAESSVKHVVYKRTKLSSSLFSVMET